MDANRNKQLYVEGEATSLDGFLGDGKWREAWANRTDKRAAFGRFVVDQFSVRMGQLGFKYTALDDVELVRSTERNLPLYHLAFFSRHDLGVKFWKQARKSTKKQQSLFGE
jgi:hypothetical protein